MRARNSYFFTQHVVVENSGVTAWTTVRTLTPSSVVNLWTRGFIEARVMGHTSGVGSGAIYSRWYFDITTGAPIAGVVGADVASGSNPGFRLNVSGNSIQLQIQSQNGTSSFDGMSDFMIFVPHGAGANGEATYTIN